jgi:two-component sensor histidine kinase/putative methionine-R-sulfoxide reductase with GAF domain
MKNNHNSRNLVDLHNTFEQFISIIHDFSIQVNKLSSVNDVYWLITKKLAPNLELLDCVIYQVDESRKELIQVAAVGEKINASNEIQNRLVLKYGEGHVGLCYESGTSIIVEDVSVSKNYIKDVSYAGSEITVPIFVENKVVAVISSESPVKAFYTDSHRKLIELIAIIASGAIQRIQENGSLKKVKIQLEEIVHQKSSDLNRAIETLSNQYSELKYQHEKMELLIQEVHHRVNNNLQIISSLLSLYSSDAEGHERVTLQNIKNRVQAMALIHQNIYKSVEMSTADVEAYVRDLINHLRSVDETNVQCVFEFKSSIKFINLNTLVPLGLLLVEIFSKWMELCKLNSIGLIQFNISIQMNDSDELQLYIHDNSAVDLAFCDALEAESIAAILISALVDQLEGDLVCCFKHYNQLTIRFTEI